MRERFGDVWKMVTIGDVLCVTTNGVVTSQGRAVMGRGIAQQVAERYPSIPLVLGRQLSTKGNHVHYLGPLGQGPDLHLVSFPVKHHYTDHADVDLIIRSVEELQALIGNMQVRVWLPRPGCGNGRLSWKTVKPLVAVLDSRFTVVSLAP